jgi:predicted HAD superfamily hydrolase
MVGDCRTKGTKGKARKSPEHPVRISNLRPLAESAEVTCQLCLVKRSGTANDLRSLKLHSFDVYDTVLTRRVAVPVDLFLMIGKQLLLRGLVTGGSAAFAASRIQAEVSARQSAPAGEARLNEMYEKLAETYGWNEAQMRQAMEIELRLELENTQAVPGMVESVQRARADGCRVMFLSDMYLPAAFIEELLCRANVFVEGDELIVSCEQRQSKHGGQMFQAIRSRLPNIKEWRHTGDNPRGDVEMPRRYGINAHHETRCVLTAHERFVRGAEQPGEGWRSQYAAAMKLARLEGGKLPKHQQAIWESGTNVAGPLWFGFAEWCLDEAQKRGIKRLYFVARDGQVFHKIASEIARRRGIPVECRYLYGSRQAWHLPGLEKLDEAAFKWIFNRQRYLTAEQVFKRVGLYPEAFQSDLAAIGILKSGWTADLSTEQAQRLRDLLHTPRLLEAVQQSVVAARDLAIRYLEQECVLDGMPYALVDIGWHGNMQRSFGTLLRADKFRKNLPVTGMYFGLQFHPPDTALDQYVSYWPGAPSELWALRTLNVALLEMMAAADHGTVLGYREKDGAFSPILDGDRNEAALAWGLELLHAAVIQFTKTWLGFASLSQDRRVEFQALSRQVLLNFVNAPTTSEANAWAQFPHSGEQIERHKENIAPALSFREAISFVIKSERRPAGWWAEGSQVRRPNVVLALFLWRKKIKQERSRPS